MKIYKNTKILIILSIILLIAFAGCTGKKEQTINQTVSSPSGDINISGKSGTGSDWCSAGTKMETSAPTGEKAAFEIKGITNYEGKDVCWAEYTYSEGSFAEYFNQDSSYAVMIMKDKAGKTINKIDISKPKQ